MLTLLLVALTVQLIAWTLLFYRALDPVRPLTKHDRPVSVVVCFYNEAKTLTASLQSLLSQRHGDFEVVAVNDNSTDGSDRLARELAADHPRLTVVDAGDTNPGKRDALRAGLRAARHDLILLTDADCVAAGPEWLNGMTAPLAKEDEVVLGCSPLRGGSGPLGAWQRYEATYVALHYQGLARRGLPYMGVGRNLAYRHSFFRESGGFTGQEDLVGGDDDLLVGRRSRARTTARATHPDTWTYSEPCPTLGAYVRQKLRHQSVGLHYRGVHQAMLSGLALSHGLFYLCGFILLFTPLWTYALMIYAVRALVVALTLMDRPVRQFLGEDAGGKVLLKLPLFLLFDLLYSFHYLFLLAATFSDRRSW